MTNQVNAAAVTKAEQPVKNKKIASLDRRKARAGWLFVLPFVLGFVLIYIPILIESVQYSFNVYKVLNDVVIKEFVGWKNYSDALFSDAAFVQTLLTGLQEMAFDIPAILIFSLFIAVILNQKMVGGVDPDDLSRRGRRGYGSGYGGKRRRQDAICHGA